jgi:hypothetical protein
VQGDREQCFANGSILLYGKPRGCVKELGVGLPFDRTGSGRTVESCLGELS